MEAKLVGFAIFPRRAGWSYSARGPRWRDKAISSLFFPAPRSSFADPSSRALLLAPSTRLHGGTCRTGWNGPGLYTGSGLVAFLSRLLRAPPRCLPAWRRRGRIRGGLLRFVAGICSSFRRVHKYQWGPEALTLSNSTSRILTAVLSLHRPSCPSFNPYPVTIIRYHGSDTWRNKDDVDVEDENHDDVKVKDEDDDDVYHDDVFVEDEGDDDVDAENEDDNDVHKDDDDGDVYVEDEEHDVMFLPWTEFFVPYVPLDWRTTCLDGEQVDAREARAISRAKNRTFVVRPGFVQRWNSPGFIHESATASREPGTYDLSDGPILRSFVAISFWRTMVTSSSRADGTAFYFVF